LFCLFVVVVIVVVVIVVVVVVDDDVVCYLFRVYTFLYNNLVIAIQDRYQLAR